MKLYMPTTGVRKRQFSTATPSSFNRSPLSWYKLDGSPRRYDHLTCLSNSFCFVLFLVFLFLFGDLLDLVYDLPRGCTGSIGFSHGTFSPVRDHAWKSLQGGSLFDFTQPPPLEYCPSSVAVGVDDLRIHFVWAAAGH